MIHLPPLIQDLGILLLTGGLVALLFSYMRQPLVVGYLLAGFLLGPNFSYFPHVTQSEGIALWGEIGVLFLLFGLGLEFSFKKLLEVGPSALVATTIEVLGMFILGFFAARKLGFREVESLFFGAMLAISSTTVLLRAIEETGTKSARFAQNIFGILIVEDFFAIVLLVLLATIGGQGQAGAASGAEVVVYTLFKFVFFLTVVFVVGISVLPMMIQKTQRILSDEMRLILSLGLCFSTVVVASKLGFSPTLGAFLMGSLLAGTREGKRVEALLLPVQQLFGAIFFISVGMLIEPAALLRNPAQAAVLLVVVIFGKTIFVTLGSLVAGKPLKPAFRSGVSMAQIGEFSFIMAALGVSLGVLKKETSSLIVMIATITALTTPYFVRNSKDVANALDTWLPERWRFGLDRYSSAVQRSGGISDWQTMIRRHLLILGVNSAMIGAIGLFFQYWMLDWLTARFGEGRNVRFAGLTLALMTSAPFFWGVVKGGLKPKRVQMYWLNRTLRPILVVFMIFRTVVFFLLASYIFTRFFPLRYTVFAGGALVAGGGLLFSKKLEVVYERFVQRFLLSLSEVEGDVESLSEAVPAKRKQISPLVAATALTPWEAHIAVFIVTVDSLAVGKTIIELQVRERYGVTITLLERGGRKIPAPSSLERIYPTDRLHVIGTDEQLAAFREFVEVASASPIHQMSDQSFSLQSHTVHIDSGFVGQSIRNCGIREKANGLVVGVERDGERVLNPAANFKILSGDLLWIVGETEKIRGLV